MFGIYGLYLLGVGSSFFFHHSTQQFFASHDYTQHHTKPHAEPVSLDYATLRDAKLHYTPLCHKVWSPAPLGSRGQRGPTPSWPRREGSPSTLGPWGEQAARTVRAQGAWATRRQDREGHGSGRGEGRIYMYIYIYIYK